MGYTHYYYRKPTLNKNKFKELTCHIKELVSTKTAQEILCEDYDDESSQPLITDDIIWFNGKGEDGHETFVIKRKEEKEEKETKEEKEAKGGFIFSFCKTAQKPYDAYVVATLLIAKIIFENDFKISSDGDIEDWEEGKKLAEEIIHSMIDIKSVEKNGFIVTSKSKLVTEEEFIKDISR